MSDADTTHRSVFQQTISEITQPFIDLVHAPQALWAINVSYLLEGLTYFGVLGLLAMYFNRYIGLNDINAGQMVGFLTAGITLSMTLFGATVDLVGARKALILSLVLMLVGRAILSGVPDFLSAQGLWSSSHLVAMFGLLWIVAGYGIYQPACYAAVRKYTNEKTAAMGYAMLYALMNLGGFLPGLISPPIRRSVGISGEFWVYVAFTAVGIAVIMLLLTKKAIHNVTNGAGDAATPSSEPRKSAKEQLAFYVKNFPLRDKRFMFFICILVPVQTLFAHNWLTLPQYCERAYTGVVKDNFEFFVNFGPLLIFVLTPVVTALTTKRDTYNMMILGTLVMGAPTFLLAIGPHTTPFLPLAPNIYTLMAFLIFMTLGEAMWSARFLQWVAEIAPKEMTGIYMGIGQFPWFMTKVITSMYSGWFLMHYCPDNTPPSAMHPEVMWFWYACIAVVTPIGLFLAKDWMKKGFKVKHEG